MNRRTFNKLAGLTVLAAMTEDVELSAEQASTMTGEVVLQDKDLIVAFDPATGALTRMEHKPTKWMIERRPALGASFRMHAPLPAQRTNFIFGQRQRAKSLEKISDNQVQIQWFCPSLSPRRSRSKMVRSPSTAFSTTSLPFPSSP
jgi:hypothetical protein